MVHKDGAGERIARLLAHPTRLAILLALSAAGGPVTLRELEKSLGVPRQTLHDHLELMVREGVVAKHRVIADRPRVVYEIEWGRVWDLLDALRALRKRLEKLEKALEETI